MADFSSHNRSSSCIEDWSLQAIVRGSSDDDFTKLVGVEMEGRDSFFMGSYNHHHHQKMLKEDHSFLSSFPELFEGSSDHELEELYKPFCYPVVSRFQQKAKETNTDAAIMVEEDKTRKNHESDQSSAVVNYAASSSRDGGYTPKYKRRKNQHKRVVIQVSAEGLTSDMWAWRKYGQKPIKGSPYPRSYYRCSSLKGCLARKQVEQSCTEPGMFIVTYTGEHNHGKPTRRNSLAGTVRQKFPSNKANGNNNIKQEKIESGNTSPAEAVDIKAQIVITSDPQARIKREDKHQGNDQGHERIGDEDSMFNNDDFFSGLEDFDDFISGSLASSSSSSSSSFHTSVQQFQVRL